MSVPERFIVGDALDALAAADVLETFHQLPILDQERFSTWIAKARDSQSRWRRIDALVMAMRSGLLTASESALKATVRPRGPGKTRNPSAPATTESSKQKDLAVTLRGSGTLELLGVHLDDFINGDGDSDLLETLRISYEVLAALKEKRVLGTFLRLPKEEQTSFLRWLTTTDDCESRRQRTATYALALKESPLGPPDMEVDLDPSGGEHRDRLAENRDERADFQDQASDARDDRADARDDRAEARDERSDAIDLGAATDRAGALRDRRGGAIDRDHAAGDRKAAASDRAMSAQDRSTLIGDRPLAPEDVSMGRLFYLIPEAVIVADVAIDRILLWNPAAERMFGYSSEEALGTPLSTLVPLRSRDEHLTGIARFNRSGPGPLSKAERPIEVKALHQDGSEFVAELSLTPVGEGPNDSLVIGILRDVTERHASTNQLIQLMKALPIGIFMTDAVGQPIYANEEARRVLGAGIVPGVKPDALAAVYQAFKQGTDELYEPERMPLVRALQGDETSVTDMEIRRPDGRALLEVWGAPILDEDGTVLNAVAAFVDINERRKVETALRDSEERFRRTFDSAPVGMAIVDLDGGFAKVNGRLCSLTGYSETELLTKTFQDITHPEDLSLDLQHVGELLAGKADSYEMEKRYLHAAGGVVWVLLSGALVRDGHGDPLHFIAQIQDITERKALEERLALEASHDPLTGVWNRRRFEEELCRHLSEAERFDLLGSVLFIDLDGLKSINDRCGHTSGDAVLKRLADVLTERAREIDAVGRLGGDEFCVLLPRADAAQAGAIARELSDRFRANPVIWGEHEIEVSASFGLATYDRKATSLPKLMADADESMYRTKRLGR